MSLFLGGLPTFAWVNIQADRFTVNRLEAMAAELLGKEAALFVPTGVMGNQLAIRLHTRPGDEVIVESSSHLIRYEGGSASSLSGVQLCCVTGDRGRLSPESVEAAIRPKDLHNPPTTLVCLEQTHNAGGGSIYPLETIHRITEVVRTHGLALHLDGARLFNAGVKTGVSAVDYARPFDTVSFCLSKGLGAPVGSIVVSDSARIQKLRRLRKVFGGGMRQAGILAAAGVYALEHHIARLAEDHANAHHLATLLQDIPGVVVDVKAVETNIVMFQVPRSSNSTEMLLADCREAGVLLNAVGDRAFRVVTHLDVTREDMIAASGIFRRVFSGAS
ncbi:MAG: GntG family PLP-dependent aldolase [Nitrospirales bacterium]